MTQREIPPLLGLALKLLRAANGWQANELAAKAGVASSTISAYETRHGMLTRDRLDELALLMELGPENVEQALVAASLVLPPTPPASWSPVDPTAEELCAIEKAAAQAGRDSAEQVRENLLRELRDDKAALALEQGKELAQRLKPYSSADRRVLIEGAPDYQHWGLAVTLCYESEKAAAHKPRRALELAELAVFVARHVTGTVAWRSRLEGWCTGFVANAQRLGTNLHEATATFSRAWNCWRAGADPAGLLSEAHLLDLEASLLRDRRLLPEALKRHAEALEVAQPSEIGSILLNRSDTLQEEGKFELALDALDQAARVIDGERQPRLRLGLRFNQASTLLRLGRVYEAEPIVGEVRVLAERLRNAVDLTKTLWLAGNVAAALGRSKEALEALRQVRRELEMHRLPYDYALASLDLALVYREEGDFAEIATLACEILGFFDAQGVHREGNAAILLLREAAEKEKVTVILLHRLKDFLAAASRNPELHFDG